MPSDVLLERTAYLIEMMAITKTLLARKVLLILLMHGSATFDAWSTRHLLNTVPRTFEYNPLLRPFSKNASLYFAIQGDALMADLLLLRRDSHPKFASAAAAAIIAVHTAAGTRNVIIAKPPASCPPAQAITRAGCFPLFTRAGWRGQSAR